jgi:hypothetical protein
MGTRAACLDWGDTVCSSNGKCVNQDAMCFDRYQCGFAGFACKSDVDECVADHDRLVGKYNEMLRDFEKLREAGKKLSAAYEGLEFDLVIQRRENTSLKEELEQAASCLRFSNTLAEAKACLH